MGFGRMWVSGMGTEVQSKIHLLGYHSIKDLNGNASGGEWPLHHESKSLRNGQFHNLFSNKPASDPFLGSDKDKLKQTILKHESIFRHQLHELHRLYKKQADLMSEIKSQEPHDHSHFNTKGKVMQCSRDRSQNGETLKDCELLESECKRPKKLFIDLERPADEYMDSEEEQLGVSGLENHSSNQNYFRETVKSGSDGAASDFNPYLSRTRDFTDLNQPVQFEKASTSISVHVPIPPSVVTCSKEEKQSWYLSANSHSAFQYSSTELSSFHRGGGEGTRNLHLQNGWNKKDQFPGRTLSGKKEFYEHETVLRPDPRTGEHQSKRTIFGVDISDGDRNASSLASHTAALHLPVTQSGLINSETVFVASQRRLPSTLSQLLAVKEHHCSNSSAYPNNAQEGLSWYREMLHNISQVSKEKEGSDNSNVKLRNGFANRDDLRKSLSQGQAQNISSAMHDHFCEDGRNKVSEYSRNSSIIGLPVSYKAREELSSCSFPARPNHLLSAIGGDNSAKVEFFETDAECQVVDKGLVNRDTEFRPCIDLNLCLTEEQDAQTTSSPKLDLNTCVEIDLEVDLQVGAEVGVTHEEHTRDAAEALVAISSSLLHNIEGDVTFNGSEVAPCNNSLNWFAELVTLHNSDLENGLGMVSAKDDHCEEEQNHNGIDYFELMTLSIEETKVEESYWFEPEVQEECNDEKAMPKRGRRGQARRGRQRKDFQRDVLPGLISLSRYEVTDDLQIIEGLIGASGGNWQSSLSRRNGAKSGRGRGRRNSTASATSSTVASPCPTQIQEPKLNTKGLEEKSLVSWGKRTRRLPRQRCLNPVTNPRIPVT